MTIIDTHMHLGMSKFSGHRTTVETLNQYMERYGITHGMVMPQPTLDNIALIHDEIYQLTQHHSGRFYGMASIDPWLSEQEYEQEFRRCIETYQFVAVKLHPHGHNISPLASQCHKVYELADQFHVPVIIHTGLGSLNALPSLVIEPARNFPNVTFVLGHAGFAVFTSEAIVAAKTCENIVLEPSWCPTFSVQSMVNEIGIDRIIYGSDHVENIPVELAKYHSVLTDKQMEAVLSTNPQRIFHLDLR